MQVKLTEEYMVGWPLVKCVNDRDTLAYTIDWGSLNLMAKSINLYKHIVPDKMEWRWGFGPTNHTVSCEWIDLMHDFELCLWEMKLSQLMVL